MTNSFEDLVQLYEQHGGAIDRVCEWFDDLGQLHGLSMSEDSDGLQTLELIFVHGIVEIPSPVRFFRDAESVLDWGVPGDDLFVRPVYILPNNPPIDLQVTPNEAGKRASRQM